MMKTLLLAASVVAVSAQSINNAAEQARLLAQAVTLSTGQYTITAADGSPMVYERGVGQAYAPGSGSPSAVTLEKLDATTMAISMGNNKCISAQWNYTVRADWAGVLYACNVGSGSQKTGLREAKQHWVFVPASGSSSPIADLAGAKIANSAKTNGLTQSGSTSKSKAVTKPKSRTCRTRKCRAQRARRQRQRQRQRQHHRRDIDELDERDLVELDKRAGNQYYIIAFDHLSDMTTRALTNAVSLTGDGLNVPSWTLNEWQEGSSQQMFTITPA